MKIRFSRFPIKGEVKGVTNRRLAASERHLKKEREKFPLLADWVASQQPTAVERIEKLDKTKQTWAAYMRSTEAAKWKKARAILASLPLEKRQEFLDWWNSSGIPAQPSYLLDAIRRKLGAELLKS